MAPMVHAFALAVGAFALLAAACDAAWDVNAGLAESAQLHQAAVLRVARRWSSSMAPYATTRGRSLLATAEDKCLWDAGTSDCGVNPKYYSVLPTPTTDGGKVVANLAYKEAVCGAYSTSATCTRNATEQCHWYTFDDDLPAACSISLKANLELLRDFAWCSGSRMDLLITCGLYEDSTTCAADKACTYLSAASGSTNVFAELALEFASTFNDVSLTEVPGSGISRRRSLLATDGTGCVATWLTNTNELNAIGNELVSTLPRDATDAQTAAAMFMWAPLYGSCATINKLRTSAAGCFSAITSSTCTAIDYCEWGNEWGNSTFGTQCAPSDSLYMDVLFGDDDAFMLAASNVTTLCDSMFTNATCQAAGSFEANSTKFASFQDIQPSYKTGAAGAVRLSPLLGALAVLCLFLFSRM